MKRIGTPSIYTSQLSGGARVVAATGVRCTETGWWFPLGNPEGRTYICRDFKMPEREGRHVDWLLAPAKPAGHMAVVDCRPASGDEHRQTWGNGIWPDCLD